MTKQELELERVATRIADDEPVDWRDLDPAAQHQSAQAVSGLREMEQLVQGFRRMQIAGGERRARGQTAAFRFGGLEAIAPIGAGTQGEVWRAYDPLLDQQVALKLRKVESGALAHQFLDEARRLARVRQANIVSVYGAAVHDGRAGIWTELVSGTTLSEVLTQQGALPAADVRAIGMDLCHALAAVHRHGLVHGDIKAQNVMRDNGGRIVLMDFGAAREFSAAAGPVVSGTLHYLAPEVLRGGAPTPGADLYALGVLLFRLLTGAYPYPAQDLEALLRMQDSGARNRLADLQPKVPADMVRAIEAALSVAPRQRPATALAFAAALTAPAARRAPWSAAVLALAATLAMLALGMSLWRGSSVPEWSALASFYRVDATGSAPLADGTPLALGDRLMLKFASNRPAYVYIFDDDDSGTAAVLFPLPGLEPGNPLRANVDHQLPGKADGTAFTWQVSSAAAREEFVVLAASAPQPELEQAIAAWRRAGELPAGTPRGALGLAPAPGETDIASQSLRGVLIRLDHDDATATLRRWRFVFPHKPG